MENKIELRDYYNKYQKEILLIGGGFIIGMMLGKFVLIMGLFLVGAYFVAKMFNRDKKAEKKTKKGKPKGEEI